MSDTHIVPAARRRVVPVRLGRSRDAFTSQELSTVLTALRVFQMVRRSVATPPVETMEHFEHVAPLTDEQIDTLCDHLNAPEGVS